MLRMRIRSSLYIFIWQTIFNFIGFPFNSISVWHSWLEIKGKRIGPDHWSENLLDVVFKAKIKFGSIRFMIMRQITYRCFVLSNQLQMIPSEFNQYKKDKHYKEKEHLKQKFLLPFLSSKIFHRFPSLNECNNWFHHFDVFPQKRCTESNHDSI